MKRSTLALLLALITFSTHAQIRKLAVIGSSTAAGQGASTPDSGWVRRFSNYYKNQLGVLDTAYNLGVSATTVYAGMPTSYVPTGGQPSPDPLHNVTQAVTLLNDVPVPANGVVIVNFPTNGYDVYTIPQIMTALQLIYDSAVRTGNKCYIATTQPRQDGNFATSAVKRKLADIKDSIINRFGLARTINCWDGMYNPADTTILAAYSAGDNVHLNNTGHRILFERVRAKNVFDLPPVEYRSNVSPTGLWNDPASWQIFSGGTWITATIPPSSGSGAITILSGDSIRINSYTELDQVTIQGGGILALFNTATPVPTVTTAALNDGAGDDLIINANGRLYVSANGVLYGTGTVRNNNGGLFTLRNRGVLEANTINDGNMWVNNTGIVRGRTLTNNEIFTLQDFTLNLVRGTFINNDSVSIIGTGTTFIADSTLVGGFFTNAATGVIFRQATTGVTNFNPSVAFTNNGRIKGFGEYVIYNPTIASTGSLAPGNSPGRLTINPAFINSRTPTLNMEISTTGAVQGVNYDHLILSSVNTTTRNISGTILNVTDNAADPIGTIYTIITPSSGTITGTFAAVNLAPTLSGPSYNSGAFITVTKTSLLPLTWGPFTGVVQDDSKVLLNWSTLQESNTAHFDIEHSSDGVHYFLVGTQNAAGNSNATLKYEFLHNNPDPANNYYRIKQVDKDNRSAYSSIINVRFDAAKLRPLLVRPNPIVSVMQVIVNRNDIQMVITDMNGRTVRSLQVAAGTHSIDMSNLPAGTYQLAAFSKGKKIDEWKLMKL